MLNTYLSLYVLYISNSKFKIAISFNDEDYYFKEVIVYYITIFLYRIMIHGKITMYKT